jgi:chemotaxis protein MotA
MVLKGASLTALLNLPAILIIFGGTISVIIISYPVSELKKIPVLLKIAFVEPKLLPKKEVIRLFTEWAMITRREGLLALESRVEEIDDEFLKNGMRMIIDGNDHDFVRDVLLEDISAMEERHRNGAAIFTTAGSTAPTLGVLGAVVGLVAALGHMEDISTLGASIAAAFIATLFGIFTGYVLWHPIATRLKQISKKEVELKMMIVEGLLSIQSGISTIAIEQKLMVFLSPNERADNEEEGVVQDAKAEAN